MSLRKMINVYTNNDNIVIANTYANPLSAGIPNPTTKLYSHSNIITKKSVIGANNVII